MNMDTARQMLQEAKKSGLRLHGISTGGRPAISFDHKQPGAELARRRFQSTQGLMRELLRAAMIDECVRLGLPENLGHSIEFTLDSDIAPRHAGSVLH
ncbi:MAG: hypothetical protein ACSHXK_02540 [Oceanococcus sp.]